MINFTRAFDSAWERTHVILFRPFDAGKWPVIGFNAFLAFLAEGGVAFNNSYSFSGQGSTAYNYHSLPAFLHGIKQVMSTLQSLATSSWLAFYLGALVIYVVAWLALNWVGCRGEFMFLDNIVRNRAAVVWPWRRYAHQGNIWFFFQLGLMVLSLLLFAAGGGGLIALNWPWIYAERNPAGGEIAVLVGSLLATLVLWLLSAVVLFLVRSFVLPVYFRQTMSLGEALLAVTRLLVAEPVSIIVYLLLSLALGIAGGIIVLFVLAVTCCLICWLAFIPFLGSMLLSGVLCQLTLPVLVFYRCFQLDCLAQFGPAYDAWIVDVPPAPDSPARPL